MVARPIESSMKNIKATLAYCAVSALPIAYHGPLASIRRMAWRAVSWGAYTLYRAIAEDEPEIGPKESAFFLPYFPAVLLKNN